MAGCRGLPRSSGIKGKLDLLWGHQGMSLQKEDWSCAQKSDTYPVVLGKKQR